METAILFVVFTAIAATVWHFLAPGEPWARSVVRGGVLAIGMLVMLSLQVRRQRRGGRR